MKEITHYTAIRSNGREVPNQIGVLDHDLKIGAHFGRLRFDNIIGTKFNEAYEKWNEWTKNRVVIFIYEE